MKRFISLFMAFVMLLGVTSSVGITAFADEEIVPYNDLISQDRVDYFSQPNCGENTGMISLSMADFDNDGNNEIISFSYELNDYSTPVIRMKLYRVCYIDNLKKARLLDSMFLYAKGSGSYVEHSCSVINQDLSFSVYQFSYSYGGSIEFEEFTTYEIKNNSFVKINDFSYEHRRSVYSYKEVVSDTIYKGDYDFFQAVKSAGYDLSAHHHMGFTDSKLNAENYVENINCDELCGNHIFSFYEDNCQEHFGFIHSNEHYSDSYYYCTDDCGLLNPYASDDEFTLGRDNNNYIHHNSNDNEGFYDRTNHSITNDFLKKQILDLSMVSNDYSLVVEKMNEKWDGSCYGIALSMAEVFNKNLNLSNFSTNNNYFQTNIKPITSEFADVIEYYYLSQYISNYGLKSDSCITTSFDLSFNKYFKNFKETVSNSEFYERLIEELKKKSVAPFAYSYSSGKGHAIIACNLKQVSDTEYRVGLYDENTVNLNSKYGKLEYFNIYFKNGKYKADLSDVLPKNLHKICFISSSKICEINPYENNFVDRLKRNEVKLYIKDGSKFKITNDKGLYFKFDGENFSGNLNILNYREIFNDVFDNQQSSYIEYELPDDDFYSYECLDDNSNKQEIILYNSDKYYSIKGNNIQSVDADFSNGIKLAGDKLDFELKINTANKKTLDCIKGNSNNDVYFEYDDDQNIVVTSDNEVDDVSLDKISSSGVKNIINNIKGDKIVLRASDEGDVEPTPGGNSGSTEPTPTPTPTPGGGSTGGGGGGASAPAPAPEPEKPDETPTASSKPSTTAPAATATKPATVKITGTKAKTKALAIYWNKQSSIDGYQVQLATDKKFKKNKKNIKVKKPNSTKKTVKKLKKNKKYYVRVRSYKVTNGKNVYGKWSKVKSVKTK